MPITVGYTPAKLAGDLAAVSGRNRGALLYEQVKSGRIRDSIAKDNLKLAQRSQRAQEDESDRRNELAQQALDQTRRDASIRNAMGLLEMTNQENALTLAREIQQAQFGRGADLTEEKFTYKQEQDKLTREAGEAAVKEEAIRYGAETKAAGARADTRIEQGDKSLDLRTKAQAMEAAAREEAEKLLPIGKQRPVVEAVSDYEWALTKLKNAKESLKGYTEKDMMKNDKPKKGEEVQHATALKNVRAMELEVKSSQANVEAVRQQLRSERSQAEQVVQLANPEVRTKIVWEVVDSVVPTARNIPNPDDWDRLVYKAVQDKGYDLTHPNVVLLATDAMALLRQQLYDPAIFRGDPR
jgi:hypothetical protein